MVYRSSTDGEYLADGTVVLDADGIPVKVAGPALDTGWRLVSHASVTAGKVLVRRIGAQVYFQLDAAVFGTLSGTQTIAGLLPAGFRPTTTGVGFPSYTTAPVYGPARGYRFMSAGDMQIHALAAGDILRASAVFPTDEAWPTTLPGTPV